MPIWYGNKETLGYTPFSEYYLCELCYDLLEPDTIFIDENSVKWDICKDCELKERGKMI